MSEMTGEDVKRLAGAALSEVNRQLRADLERVTRERDDAYAEVEAEHALYVLAAQERDEAIRERDRLRAAAQLPDPVYRDQFGRVTCVYCGSIEEDGHSTACPWVKLNVVVSLTDPDPGSAAGEAKG